MEVEELKSQYLKVLSKIDSENFEFTDDKYSGVFLPYHFEEYVNIKPKIMIIGRETAGWNTNNKKNTLKRIVDKNSDGLLSEVIDESFSRYSWHLKTGVSGKNRKKHKSKFQHYYNKVSKELRIPPDAMIYSNLFAWDYDGKSPLTRPETELNKIVDISLELLALQIEFFNPEFLIFATGYSKIDPLIKKLFEVHFDGYKTQSVIPKKKWNFIAANRQCFRIAHPRAQHGHAKYRAEVIDDIKKCIQLVS